MQQVIRNSVLITGMNGFLGSTIAKRLVVNGFKVHGLVRKASELKRLDNILEQIDVHIIDDIEINDLISTLKPKAIIHTATSYGRKGETNLDIMISNTIFPASLLFAAKTHGVEVFVNSDTVLDKFLNAYSLSKNNLLDWGKFVSLDGQIKFINMKLQHLIGPNDDEDKFTAMVIRSCLRNENFIDLTPGEQKRDFIDVDDAAAAYQCVISESEKLDSFSQFEVGSGNAISIKTFCNIVKQITNSTINLNFGKIPYRSGEIMHTYADIEKLKLLGWHPCIPLEQSIQKVISKEARGR